MVKREPRARGLETRRKVMEATLEVVSERPLAEVQLQQIAARAGLSAGHVLYHFGSKDGILVETLAWAEDGIAEERARALADAPDPVAQLRLWVVMYLPRSADDPVWKLWLELWLRAGSGDKARSAGSVPLHWEDDYKQIIMAGAEVGAFTREDGFDEFWNWSHALLIGLSIGVLTRWQSLEEATGTALFVLGRALRCTFP